MQNKLIYLFLVPFEKNINIHIRRHGWIDRMRDRWIDGEIDGLER